MPTTAAYVSMLLPSDARRVVGQSALSPNGSFIAAASVSIGDIELFRVFEPFPALP